MAPLDTRKEELDKCLLHGLSTHGPELLFSFLPPSIVPGLRKYLSVRSGSVAPLSGWGTGDRCSLQSLLLSSSVCPWSVSSPLIFSSRYLPPGSFSFAKDSKVTFFWETKYGCQSLNVVSLLHRVLHASSHLSHSRSNPFKFMVRHQPLIDCFFFLWQSYITVYLNSKTTVSLCLLHQSMSVLNHQNSCHRPIQVVLAAVSKQKRQCDWFDLNVQSILWNSRW